MGSTGTLASSLAQVWRMTGSPCRLTLPWISAAQASRKVHPVCLGSWLDPLTQAPLCSWHCITLLAPCVQIWTLRFCGRQCLGGTIRSWKGCWSPRGIDFGLRTCHLVYPHSGQSPYAEGRSSHRRASEPHSVQPITDKLHWSDSHADSGPAFPTDTKNPSRYRSGALARWYHISKSLGLVDGMWSLASPVHLQRGFLPADWPQKNTFSLYSLCCVYFSQNSFLSKDDNTNYYRIF